MTTTQLAHQYFEDLMREKSDDNDDNLRAWLWFTCPAHLRSDVEGKIRGMRTRSWNVEEHTGGRSGIGAGSSTGTYYNRAAALNAACAAKARGNGVTIISRGPDGRGEMLLLDLVNPMPDERITNTQNELCRAIELMSDSRHQFKSKAIAEAREHAERALTILRGMSQ